ncbi:MAG: putative hydroxymethylpyrimidine transporter CytX [Hyphomonadaceae bacterium]|nr:putative hydroxymethylpyrimidine transporter CytX [Clostridia bacterium]
METKQSISNVSSGLLWFGAAISIAEIIMGTYIAPLGFAKGSVAIVLGHVIGIFLLYLCGLIGAESKLASIQSSRISFGKYGSYIFSVLNILQLIGWTAIMIISCSKALGAVGGGLNEATWCLITGALIIVWILVGMKNLGKLNSIAVGALFVLTLVLSFLIFKSASAGAVEGTMTFGRALEISIAMPLSWLPLISDYTRFAKKSKQAAIVSSVAYFIGSTWMYLIGLGAAIYAGTSDITQILAAAGLGIAALIIVVMATVTTTFLDVYSAAVSFTNIRKKTNEKLAAIVVCVLGTLIAIFTPIEAYQDFLLLIGSVFAPMITILITDYFIFKKRDISGMINITNIVLWVVGFMLYRWFLSIDTLLGSTVPVMIIISILCILVHYASKKFTQQK